jgi:hypothetical protein
MLVLKRVTTSKKGRTEMKTLLSLITLYSFHSFALVAPFHIVEEQFIRALNEVDRRCGFHDYILDRPSVKAKRSNRIYANYVELFDKIHNLSVSVDVLRITADLYKGGKLYKLDTHAVVTYQGPAYRGGHHYTISEEAFFSQSFFKLSSPGPSILDVETQERVQFGYHCWQIYREWKSPNKL